MTATSLPTVMAGLFRAAAEREAVEARQGTTVTTTPAGTPVVIKTSEAVMAERNAARFTRAAEIAEGGE